MSRKEKLPNKVAFAINVQLTLNDQEDRIQRRIVLIFISQILGIKTIN